MLQSKRVLVVMALLDLKLLEWEKWMTSVDESDLDLDVANSAKQMVWSLQNPDAEGSAQLYLQAIAVLNDTNLADLVSKVQSAQG